VRTTNTSRANFDVNGGLTAPPDLIFELIAKQT